MPKSPYVRAIRRKIGSDLLMLQGVTVMLFDDQGRLLLARDAESGFWMTIGGAVEPNETPSDAAVRECWEETGLLIEPISLVGIFGGPDFRVTYPNGDIVSYVVTIFEVRQIGGEASPDGLEASALCFASRSEAATLPMRAWTKEMIARAFEHKENGAPYFAKARWLPKEKRATTPLH
jgi:8-oxo-dGTP pyrophosphatase MutT (NUDIX family)